MKIIIGTKAQYYRQDNNAQVALFKDYFNNPKNIACGPESFVMGLDIAGWPMDVFTPFEQPGDSVLMMAHNPANLKAFKKRRNLDYNKYPPNEVPQIYDVIGKMLYDRDDVCKFEWGLDFEIIKNNIINRTPMLVAGDFPAGGHFVLIVGFDDTKQLVYYNDPFPLQWENKNGFNREMDMVFLNTKIQTWRTEIYRYGG